MKQVSRMMSYITFTPRVGMTVDSTLTVPVCVEGTDTLSPQNREVWELQEARCYRQPLPFFFFNIGWLFFCNHTGFIFYNSGGKDVLVFQFFLITNMCILVAPLH